MIFVWFGVTWISSIFILPDLLLKLYKLSYHTYAALSLKDESFVSHVQISELSLEGFIVGYPFDRQRTVPNVCLYPMSFQYYYPLVPRIQRIIMFLPCVRLSMWSFLSMIFVRRGSLRMSSTHIGMNALHQRSVLCLYAEILGYWSKFL